MAKKKAKKATKKAGVLCMAPSFDLTDKPAQYQRIGPVLNFLLYSIAQGIKKVASQAWA